MVCWTKLRGLDKRTHSTGLHPMIEVNGRCFWWKVDGIIMITKILLQPTGTSIDVNTGVSHVHLVSHELVSVVTTWWWIGKHFMILYTAMQHNTIICCALRCNTMQHSTKQHKAIHEKKRQYESIPDTTWGGVAKSLFANFAVRKCFNFIKGPVKFFRSHCNCTAVAAAELRG